MSDTTRQFIYLFIPQTDVLVVHCRKQLTIDGIISARKVNSPRAQI